MMFYADIRWYMLRFGDELLELDGYMILTWKDW
jgi:hypothetical protein